MTDMPHWPGDNAPELQRALYELEAQEHWIDDCGGSLLGYLLNYGSFDDREHSGAGGQAIYEADIVEDRDPDKAARLREIAGGNG